MINRVLYPPVAELMSCWGDNVKTEGINRYYNKNYKSAFKKEKKKNTSNFKNFLDNELFACRECGELLVSEEEKEQQRHHACKSAWIDRQNKEFEKCQLTIFDL